MRRGVSALPAIAAAAAAVALTSARLRSRSVAHAHGQAPTAAEASATTTTTTAASQGAKLVGSGGRRRLQLVVEMTCEGCARDVRGTLGSVGGVEAVDADVPRKLVVVSGAGFQTSEVLEALEAAGRPARVVGMGSSGLDADAVGVLVPPHVGTEAEAGAIVVEYKGEVFGHGSVVGVVRAVQTTPAQAVVEWEIAGLKPLARHAVAVHEFGDLRGGPATVGRPTTQLGSATTNDKGVARFGPELLPFLVWDAIGRGVVVSREGEGALVAAVAARSAGVDANTQKRVCTCDGTTIWEGSGLVVERPSL